MELCTIPRQLDLSDLPQLERYAQSSGVVRRAAQKHWDLTDETIMKNLYSLRRLVFLNQEENRRGEIGDLMPVDKSPQYLGLKIKCSRPDKSEASWCGDCRKESLLGVVQGRLGCLSCERRKRGEDTGGGDLNEKDVGERAQEGATVKRKKRLMYACKGTTCSDKTGFPGTVTATKRGLECEECDKERFEVIGSEDLAEMLHAEKPDISQPRCSNCYQIGHERNSCTEPDLCPTCRSHNHGRPRCEAKHMTCPKCGEKGHPELLCTTLSTVAEERRLRQKAKRQIQGGAPCPACGARKGEDKENHVAHPCNLCKDVKVEAKEAAKEDYGKTTKTTKENMQQNTMNKDTLYHKKEEEKEASLTWLGMTITEQGEMPAAWGLTEEEMADEKTKEAAEAASMTDRNSGMVAQTSATAWLQDDEGPRTSNAMSTGLPPVERDRENLNRYERDLSTVAAITLFEEKEKEKDKGPLGAEAGRGRQRSSRHDDDEIMRRALNLPDALSSGQEGRQNERNNGRRGRDGGRRGGNGGSGPPRAASWEPPHRDGAPLIFCRFFSRKNHCRYGTSGRFLHSTSDMSITDAHRFYNNQVLMVCERVARRGRCRHRDLGQHM